jgi:excinuclease ABC subunit C
MKEVLTRRFIGKETSSFPDLIIIDGGLGQLSVAKKVLATLNIKNVEIISISKGKLRNSSNETFYDIKGNKIILRKTEPLFYYLQRLRDEAHRFAITNHRTKREKEFFKSEMDYIDKIGPKRKKNLILYFGSLNEIKRASLEKLEKVPGINKKIAETIYNYFNIN